MKPVLTGCLDPGFPAHHQPVVVLRHAVVLAFVRGAVPADPLEAGDVERAVGQHKGVLAVHDHGAVLPPGDGDGLDALHLAVEEQGLLLHRHVVAGLHHERQLGGTAEI